MWLKNNYQKFKKHLRYGGLFYALWRGVKYFIYLIKKQREKLKPLSKENKEIISKGGIKIFCSGCGINIFWNNSELTRGAGLNVGVNTLGLWTDSAKAEWQIIEKGIDHLKVKVIFRDLPLSQTWILKIEEEQKISWRIDIEIEERLHIDEFRIVSLVNPHYKLWISDYKHGNFPRLDNNWHDIYREDQTVTLVGVRFPIKDKFLPSLIIESQNNDLYPLIQNPPLNFNSHIIGFRRIDSEEKRNYLKGNYQIFSGKISLFEDDELLDTKIEGIRQKKLEEVTKQKRKTELKILLVNLPWQRKGIWGVRAGSRWPHIKDETEGDYLPFPFFLAYATSLLQKNGIDALIIDAIAEQIPEDKFLEKISRMNFDYLVAETSIPSFYDDLNILKKISSHGIPIILCGPNSEIYQSKFLKEHPFINFVLFGEYEFTLLDLVQCLQEDKDLSKVKGLIYKDNNTVIKNPKREPFDINLLPWPHRDGLPMDKYLDAPGGMSTPSVQMMASRGCPFKCQFCLWPQVIYQGHHYRFRKVKDVVDEMEFLVHQKKFKSIYFDDDTFNIGKKRMLDFCQEIKIRGLDNIQWAIMARPDLMDEEILTNMKSSGLWAVKYGMETCSPSLIKNCYKNLDLEKTTKMVKLTKDLGIKVHLTFCFGFPGETKETIQETIDYALSLEPNSLQFSVLTPFPGTQLFKELDRQNRILTKDWSKYDGHYECVFKPDNLNPEDLVRAKIQAYRLWGEYMRKKRGFRGDVKRFSVYWQKKGIIKAFQKTISYLFYIFIKRRGFLREKSLENLKEPSRSKIRLVYKKIKTIGFISTFRKIKNTYLEIMGIFSKRFAFKGPNFVQIDLTNKCNNNCIACWCNSPLLKEKRNDEQSIPYEKIISLLDTLKKMGTEEIYLSGGGEPFIYPQILEVIRYIKKKGFICHINTNFTLLDETIISELVKLKLDYLIVSLWAGSPDIYEITHPNKDKMTFYKIKQMLKFLIQIRERNLPRVYIINVIFNLNWQDIENMINFALEVKVDGIYFMPIDVIPGATDVLLLDQAQRNEVLKTLKRILDKEDIRKRLDLSGIDTFIKRLSNPFSNEGNYDKGLIDNIPCYIGWLFSRILANGDVNACLKAHRIPVGNIYIDNFQKIWNSQKQQEFRNRTYKAEKMDLFFTYIGNKPEVKEAGCYRCCDDFGRNVRMHGIIESLSTLEKKLCSFGGRILSLKENFKIMINNII